MKSNNLLTHERLAGVALAATTAIAGALATSPAITDMDGGEFALIAARGGIAHPPGYPLYSALLRGWHEAIARHFTAPPEITSPQALATLSVMMAVATALLVWRAVFNIAGTKTPELAWRAALATGLVMVSWPVLRASTAIEPFAANNLMAAGLLYVAARELSGTAKESRQEKTGATWRAFATGLLFGLAFCNHHSLAFAAPMAFCLSERARKQPARVVMLVASGFLAGCLPIAWFFAQANNATGPVWGDWQNFGSQLVRHLFRRGYGTFQLTAEASGTVMGGPWFMIQVLGKSLGALAILAAVGIVLACRNAFELDARGKRFATCALASFLGSGIAMPMLFRQNPTPDAAEIMARFAALPMVFLIPFVAFGAAPLTRRQIRECLKMKQYAGSPALGAAILTGVAAVILGAINPSGVPVKFWGGRSGETLANLHLDLAAEIAARSELGTAASMPAVIVTNSDLDYFGHLYKNARKVPGRPPAVVIQSGLWPTRWHRTAALAELVRAGFDLPGGWLAAGHDLMANEDSFRLLAAILQRLSGVAPVNLAAGTFPAMDQLYPASYPLGPFIRVVKDEGAIPAHDAVLRLNEELAQQINAWQSQRRPATAWENHALDGWRRSWVAVGIPAGPDIP